MSYPRQPSPATRRASYLMSGTREGGSDAPGTGSWNSQGRKGSTEVCYSGADRPAAETENRSCCCVCCAAICSCLGHDRIYGSFIGPHPVNFMWCCCKCCCRGTCVRPFALASVSTKMMWFLMLFFVTVLACFFIIPYPENKDLDAVGHFWPCGDYYNEHKEWNPKFVRDNISLTCRAHGGYFMVYRVFFSFVTLLAFFSCLMIGVQSVNLSPLRAKVHHGFWFYKYFCLVGLLLLCFIGIRVEGGGIFEYIMSWIGLVASIIFSFIELTMLMDIVEMYITNNKCSQSDWADFCYWFVTALVAIFDLIILTLIGSLYLVRRRLLLNPGDDTDNPAGDVSFMHLLIYLYGIFLSIGIIGVSIWITASMRDYYSILRSLFVVAYIQGMIWGTLSVSPDIHARPHYNIYKSGLQPKLQDGNADTYFKADGCFQGLTCLATLTYYLFWHGPRSQYAPLSILFDRIWYWKANKPSIPVVPQKLSTCDEEQYSMSVQKYAVWEDERLSVRYSWTIFYVIMILASLTLMMSMTNFSDPWALQWYCSSYPALGMKLFATVFIAGLHFFATLTMTSKTSPELKRKVAQKDVDEDEESRLFSKQSSIKNTSLTDSKAPSKKDSVVSEPTTTVALIEIRA